MYWDKLLREVLLNKDSGTKSFSLAGIDHNQYKYSSTKNTVKLPRSNLPKAYWLGEKYHGVYFSLREAECMVQLLKGKTVHKVAETIKLSPRTIEYYLKNMKAKVGCRTKFELVEKVSDSDFLKHVDFIS